MNAFYGRLQRLALLPLALFLWSGLADEMLGWPGVLPFGLGAAQGNTGWLAVAGTWIELLAPFGLFFAYTRPSAALTLSAYAMALAFVFHPFWAGDDGAHTELQGFLLSAALSGALLYVFAAARLANRERRRRAAREAFGASRPSQSNEAVGAPPAPAALVVPDPALNWMRRSVAAVAQRRGDDDAMRGRLQ